MDRRNFLKYSATGLLGLTVADKLSFAEACRRKKAGSSYSVVILGDTHYDTAPDTVYHTGYSDPNPTREANHRKEFVRNSDMWADRCPRLLKRASCLVDDDTRMVVQLGDLIQGDCSDQATHAKFLDDAFTMIKKAMGPLPLVTVAGNHDLRGRDDRDAVAAYNEYMPAKLSAELGKTITKTTYSFMVGEDAFIAIDFTNLDVAEIEKAFEDTRKCRYTFIIVHAPFFAYQSKASYNWVLHGRNSNPEARARFRKLAASRNAIILCGHTHTTELHQWEGDGGKITQMTMHSVWASDANAHYKVVTDNVADYGKNMPEESKPLFDEVRSGLKSWVISKACGSYKLFVSDEGVYVDFYAGDDSQRSERFILR